MNILINHRLIFVFNKLSITYTLNLLARVGVVNSNYLKTREDVIVIILLWPSFASDPITQVGLAIPLLLLYELSIFTVKLKKRRRNRNA